MTNIIGIYFSIVAVLRFYAIPLEFKISPIDGRGSNIVCTGNPIRPIFVFINNDTSWFTCFELLKKKQRRDEKTEITIIIII